MVNNTRLLLRAWIDEVLRKTQWTKTRLAREAGVSTTTITRLYDDQFNGGMTMNSVAKIARVADVPPPSTLGGGPEPQGFAEPETTPWQGPAERDLTANQTIWTVNTAGLAAMGLMPGDRFILDQALAPRNRDIVVVQVYDNQAGTTETLLRVFADGFAVSPLYLVDGSKRLWIDDTNVKVMGTIRESWRTRTAT